MGRLHPYIKFMSVGEKIQVPLPWHYPSEVG